MSQSIAGQLQDSQFQFNRTLYICEEHSVVKLHENMFQGFITEVRSCSNTGWRLRFFRRRFSPRAVCYMPRWIPGWRLDQVDIRVILFAKNVHRSNDSSVRISYLGRQHQVYSPELSTGHFSWTKPGETLIRPAIADKNSDPTQPRARPFPHMYIL